MLYIKSTTIGFMGCGNMSQAIIKGLIESKIISADRIFVSNRSTGKMQKLAESLKVNICQNNEELIEKSTIVVLGMKPQDLLAAIEPLISIFNDKQIVMSLAAGITMNTLKKHLSNCRLIRLMPNTPTLISKGITGYFIDPKTEQKDSYLETIVEDLFKSLGKVIKLKDEDQLEAFMIACSSGVGFAFEFMSYFKDWLAEHDFDEDIASELTIETFLGASLLAKQNLAIDIEELQARVASKKGVTSAGLESIREQEIERSLRVAFEKAALRNQEMAKLLK